MKNLLIRQLSLNYKLFRPFGSILGTSLTPVRNTKGIKRTAYNMIANTRQVLYPASANQNNRMLLQVMADARDV
jgi:hypothetical protein